MRLTKSRPGDLTSADTFSGDDTCMIAGPVSDHRLCLHPNGCDHQFSPLTVRQNISLFIYDLCDTMILPYVHALMSLTANRTPKPHLWNHNEARVVFPKFFLLLSLLFPDRHPLYQCSLHTAFSTHSEHGKQCCRHTYISIRPLLFQNCF